jgi:hypothetical protein
MIGSKDCTTDTIMHPKREHRPFAYPLWPTSKPGPGATLPPPGQKPLSTRTDQLVYACSDQERGMPCVPPPSRVVPENRTRAPLPDISLQEVDSEAMERWLDDGGASDIEAAYVARGFSPLQFFGP